MFSCGEGSTQNQKNDANSKAFCKGVKKKSKNKKQFLQPSITDNNKSTTFSFWRN